MYIIILYMYMHIHFYQIKLVCALKFLGSECDSWKE